MRSERHLDVYMVCAFMNDAALRTARIFMNSTGLQAGVPN